MLTRTSLSQTINQTQLILDPYRIPKILSDFPNQKPLLLAWDSIRAKEPFGRYDYLLDGAQLIYKRDALELYRLPLRSFSDRIERRKQTILQTLDTARLYPIDNFLSTDSVKNFVYQSWDDRPTPAKHYFGKSGFEADIRAKNVVFDGTVPAQKRGWYLFSIWMFLNKDLHPRTKYEIVEYTPDNQEVQRIVSEVRYVMSTFDNNGWGIMEQGLTIHAANNRLRITFSNDETGKQPFWLDELFIRSGDCQVYRKTDGVLWHNNRWWKH